MLARETPSMKHSLLPGLLPLLLLAACGTSGASTGSPANPGTIAGQESVALSAGATAPTEAQASALARRRLLAALLADESLTAANPLHERLAAAVHVERVRLTQVDGGIQAQVGLTRDSLRQAFDRLDSILDTAPEPQGPNALSPALHALRMANLRRASCLRKRQLAHDGACQPVDTSAQSRQLEQILANVRLRPVHTGGIPMKDQSWLRPLMVKATLANGEVEQPLPELALRILASDRSPAVVVHTDARGVATRTIAKDTPAATTWTVSLDLDGPLSGAQVKLPLSITLQGRPTGHTRSALVHAHGKTPAAETGRALMGALEDHFARPVELAKAEAQQLAEAGMEKMKDLAPQVAEHLHGALDTILLLDAESEFASRMGTQRVWYEARGTLRVYHAWTGELMTEVSATVTEAGLGEERAESAAQASLGRELATKLRHKLGLKLAIP